MQNYNDCQKKSKMFKEHWIAYFKDNMQEFELKWTDNKETDMLGCDLTLTNKNGKRLIKDVKVFDGKYTEYPIELKSNVERDILGWAYKSNGIHIVMVRVDFIKREFVDAPLIFEITDKFKERICGNKQFSTSMADTEGLYHTLIRIVPKEYIENHTNDYWWASKFGRQKKVWE